MLDKVFTDERKKEYINVEGRDKPLKSPISNDVLDRARAYRKQRMVDQVNKYDCAAILMYDPLNTRYVFDAPNMQVWATHNAFRYSLLFGDGYGMDFQFPGAEHLSQDNPLINEVDQAITWFYFVSGDRTEERVEQWADQIVGLLKKHGGGNMRLAIDRCEPPGIIALQKRGVEIINGQRLSEWARSVKSPDELELMKWTIRVCEAGMARMYENSLPGKTENEIWAELHYENIRSGGEWIETRLLTVGERTNPWFQESSDHVAKEGDMLAFDTDMIGPYGYCADISRSWTIGYTPFTPTQHDLYAHALDHIEHNCSIIKAGMTFREFNEKSWKIPERFQALRYSCAAHGTGLCDEWPLVPLHPDFDSAYEGYFQDGQVISVETLTGEKGGRESVKLETQCVIREHGVERLETFPFEKV